eukprot:jgi/Hompol1/318/HPOL_002902-RA
MADLDSKIRDVQDKIRKERMVLDGATRMLAVQTKQSARQLVEISVVEAQHRLEFLEGELRKLSLKKDPAAAALASPIQQSSISSSSSSAQASVGSGATTLQAVGGSLSHSPSGPGLTVLGESAHGSTESLGVPEETSSASAETHFDYVRYGTAITAEKVKFRLKQIQTKLDIEQKVRTGTENMLSALGPAIESDPKRKAELDQQLTEAKSKEMLLLKAKNKFTQLYVAEDENEDGVQFADVAQRKTGRLSMKIMGAANITGRKSLKEDIYAQVVVDGIIKFTTRPSKQKWDETTELTVDKALEVEINVYEKAGPLLAMCWFRIVDLEEHLEKRYGNSRPAVVEAVQETWLEMEPSGQLLLKLNFAAVQRSKTERDRIFRRNPVQKVYPRNGHRFLAQQFYQIMQCALCNEFLGRQGYQCQACNYVIHAKCYHRVITQCIPPDEMAQTEDKNTGKLLIKYNIPHKFENSTAIFAAWCGHCGYLLPPGKKIKRCSACSRTCHRDCSPMIPNFCGLAPDMADTLPRKPTIVTAPRQSQAVRASKEVSLDDFHFVSVLGRGAFGKVMLATEKNTNQLYAIKALKKEFIIQNDDVKSTKLEKSIFQAASAEHHPFMVNLHSSFHTDTRVYFVMEYVSGGDLMCHIQEKKRFSQGRTRFYACEVLLALQYFHQNNIVYRDLKLDNILLGADGHIKVADYGICKAGMPYGATTSTFCGTPDYMAPEILMNRRYGVAVDWWSFGVLIFVMMVGRYPFHGEDENDILEAILADSIEYPSSIPRIALSLLQSLMNKVPSRRLGAGAADAEEVKKHPYFANIDWDAFMRKEIPPPFIPNITDPYDVSNFDKEFTSEEPVLTPLNNVLGEADQREFSDFHYLSEWAYQARIAAIASAPS